MLALFRPLAQFVRPPLVRVFHGRQEIGEVHQSTFMVRQEGPSVRTLGGRAWRAKHVDRPHRKAYVEPTHERGRSRWLSAGQPLSFVLCQAMTRVLAREDHPVRFSRRALDLMQTLRERYDSVAPERSALVRHDDGTVRWWTFAGRLVNAALARALHDQAAMVRPDNFAIGFQGSVPVRELRAAIRGVLSEPCKEVAVPLDEDFVAGLKFGVCLPPRLCTRVLRARSDRRRDLEVLAGYPVSVARLTGQAR